MERELPEKLQELSEDLEEVLENFGSNIREIMVSVGSDPPTASDFNKLGKYLDMALAGFKETLIGYLDELEYDICRN